MVTFIRCRNSSFKTKNMNVHVEYENAENHFMNYEKRSQRQFETRKMQHAIILDFLYLPREILYLPRESQFLAVGCS